MSRSIPSKMRQQHDAELATRRVQLAWRVVAVAALLHAAAPRAQVVNGTFEAGLTGWAVGGTNQAAALGTANVAGGTVTPPGGAGFGALSTGAGDRNGAGQLYDGNTTNDFDFATLTQTFTYNFGAAPAVLQFDWNLPSGEQDQQSTYDDLFDARATVNGVTTQVFARSICRNSGAGISNFPDAPCTGLGENTWTIVNAAPISGTALRFGVGAWQRTCVALPNTVDGVNTVTLRFAVLDQGDSGYDTAAFIDNVQVREACDATGDAAVRQITATPATFAVSTKTGGFEARPIASRLVASDYTGSHIAFASSANLTGDNPNAFEQVFVYDGSAYTRLSSLTIAALPADGGPAIVGLAISGSSSNGVPGRFVAVAAHASASDNAEIYRIDRTNGARLTITNTSSCTNDAPTITDDGSRIAYVSTCNAETGVANGVARVVYRVITGTTVGAVQRPMGTSTTCTAENPRLNRNGGRYLALDSVCSLAGNTNADGSREVFRYDTNNASWTQVSANSASTAVFSQGPTFSADGRYVMYVSSGEQDNITDTGALNADGSFEVIRWDANGAANENRVQLTNGTQLVLPIAANIAANGAFHVVERLDVLTGVTTLVRRSNTTFAGAPNERPIVSGNGFFGGYDLGADGNTAVVPFGTAQDVTGGNADQNPEIFTARVPQ